jgi:hypothetical protein
MITELQPEEVYVIGGIVDRNRFKGLCFERAKELGIKHGQLPISENIKLKSRKVLTVNHGAFTTPPSFLAWGVGFFFPASLVHIH